MNQEFLFWLCSIKFSTRHNWLFPNKPKYYGSVSTYYRNLKVLARKMFNIRRDMLTPITSDLFKMKWDPCNNLTNNDNFRIPSVKEVFNGLKNIYFWNQKSAIFHLTFAVLIWNFKKSIKKLSHFSFLSPSF